MIKIGDLMNIQNKGREMRSDEYLGEDGLFYCKKCKTKRQVIIGDRKLSCICKCQEKKRDDEEKQKEIDAKRAYINSLKEKSLLGRRYNNVTFENSELGFNTKFDEVYNYCKSYCDDCDNALKEGRGIYIFGNKGTGKTHLTACMVDALSRQYKPCLLTNFFEISKEIRKTFNGRGNESALIENITNIDFLFIDDLGTELVKKNGEDNWLQEKIFEIINLRYNNLKPTIFTSNHSLNELINDRGFMDKTIDRIYEMSKGAIFKIEGKSYRMKAY